MAEDEYLKGANDSIAVRGDSSRDGATVQIDDFIDGNIAEISPDYSEFVNNIKYVSDNSEGSALSFGSGLPSGFSLSSGSSITISPDDWSIDEAPAGDGFVDELSDFGSDGDPLGSEAIAREVRTNDPAGGSSAAASISTGAADAV